MEVLVLLNAKIRARMIAPTIAATVALVVVRAVAQVDVREVVAAGVQLRVVPAVPALQNQALAQVVVPHAQVDVLEDAQVVVVRGVLVVAQVVVVRDVLVVVLVDVVRDVLEHVLAVA